VTIVTESSTDSPSEALTTPTHQLLTTNPPAVVSH